MNEKPRIRVPSGRYRVVDSADHLELWRQVDKTPTTAVREASVDGQQITTLDAMHVIELATKVFGPMGIGWGYRIEDERYDIGAPVLDNKGQLIAHEQTHTIRLALWYRWHGERGEVTQFGHTRAVYRTGTGKWKTDGEAPKKSITDAIKKCLSLLGFAADVYYGKFDNKDYTETQQAATRIAVAENQDAEIDKLRQDYADWLKRECDTLRNKIPHPKSIELASAGILSRLPDKASIARVEADKGRDMIIKARDEGIARVYAEQEKAKQQKEEATHD
ncbi:Rad52/Rad22 family DNA repair protein [Vreelandella sp. 21]|uniref:Rad52/Rad22 family DNA repair protein n=1 Tax=Vreelandella sp. 21 TaxID=3402864 RepID=UPI003D9A880F